MTYEFGKEKPQAQNHGLTKYPLTELEIDQFFFVPNGDIRKVSSAVTQAMKKRKGCLRKKFVCRSSEHNGVKGVKVYRVPHEVFDGPEFLWHQWYASEASRLKRLDRHERGMFFNGEPQPGEPDYVDPTIQKPKPDCEDPFNGKSPIDA